MSGTVLVTRVQVEPARLLRAFDLVAWRAAHQANQELWRHVGRVSDFSAAEAAERRLLRQLIDVLARLPFPRDHAGEIEFMKLQEAARIAVGMQ